MRAIVVMQAGREPALGELPAPALRPGHVLLRVAAAALSPIDALIGRGAVTAMFPHEYPIVLGRDASGIVEAIGDGVDGISIGDAVFGHVPFGPPVHDGVLAEYAELPADAVAPLPPGLDHVRAAALPLSGTAAATLVNAVEPSAGQTVLVNGASGGVGSFVVQLLAARGADVIATGTPDDAARLARLGAARVLDFTHGPIAEQLLAVHPGGVDALVNLFGMTLDQVPMAAVTRGGVVATATSAPKSDALEAAGLRGGLVKVTPRSDQLAQLAQDTVDGRLSVEVEAVVPLGDTIEWLSTIAEGRAHGKIVIDLTA